MNTPILRRYEGWLVYLLFIFFLTIFPTTVVCAMDEATYAIASEANEVLALSEAKNPSPLMEEGKGGGGQESANVKVQETYGKLPLYFIQNSGQVDEKVKFYEKGNGRTTFFTKEGVYISLTNIKQTVNSKRNGTPDVAADFSLRPTPKSGKNAVPQFPSPHRGEGQGEGGPNVTSEIVKLAFLDSNKNPEIIAEDVQEGKVNYFIGNDPAKWRTNISTFKSVVYKEVYPGIDVKFYGNNRQMEYDIVVKPGADPSKVRFAYEGIKDLKVAENGDLEIVLKEGSIIQKKPVIYQEIDGKWVAVDGKFVIASGDVTSVIASPEGAKQSLSYIPSPLVGEGKGEGDSGSLPSQFAFSFELAAYDKNHPLIIDPTLVYSTYLGGSSNDVSGYGIAVDGSGSAYVTGYTGSSNFPTTFGAYDTTFNGAFDAFVVKLNATGSALSYATYLGGSSNAYGEGIAVDGLGNAYVMGETSSSNFPTTSGAYDTAFNGGPSDAFVLKLNTTGSALSYATYLGGSSDDGGFRIVVDGSGSAYVTGYTSSSNFPTTSDAYDATFNGGTYDAFVVKLNATGSALSFATYIGGSSYDYGYGIAVDGSGSAYVTGYTASSNFPTTPGSYDTTHNGNSDVFITKLNLIEPTSYSIIGKVTENSTGLGNVTMSLSGADSATTTTATGGTYSFTGLANGTYTITPSKSGYLFDPPDHPVTVAGSDVTGKDFSAFPCSPLSGILRDATTDKPLSGVTITVDGTKSASTASDGSYNFSCLPLGIHTVTVSVPSGYMAYVRTIDLPFNSTWNIKLTKEQTVNGTDTNSGYSADPVNTATGNYTYQRSDIEIPGIGIPFAFERAYNSRDAQDGPLGFGWSHSYNAALTVNPDSTITIRWGDGKTETWTPDGLGGFTPQYGVFDTLIDNGDGTYTLKKKDLIRYNFDSAGRLASIVDKNGNSVSLTYTGANLTQITDTAGRVITFTYNASNRITLITDPIPRTIQFTYDANGDLVSATDMNGNPTSYTYDINHQLLTATDPRGNPFVTNIYDDSKRVVVSQKDAKLGVTLYLYDEVDRKTTIIDQLGNPTIHYHDELLRLIQEKDARGYSTYYTYDEAGNRTEVRDRNGKLTKYGYDANGNVTSKTDALNIVTSITYDANNNPLTRTEAVGIPLLERTTTFEYDSNGNLSKTTDPLEKFTTITYDAHGLPLTITDPRGSTTTNAYDPEGNLKEVTNALEKKTKYTYDGAGRRLTATDALLRTTTYNYDKNNNLLTVTDPIGTITYTYDKNNNKETVKDKKGKTTQYTYDVKDFLETITDPYTRTIINTYDALDRKKSITDKNGNQINYDYDAVGNLIKVIDPYLKETTFTYDGNGNKLTETDPLTHTTTYKYDALNRITDITDQLDNTTVTAYDVLGRVSSTTNAKLQTTYFEYDALGRLTNVTDADTGMVQYTYDSNGNRLTMVDPNNHTTSYEYDALNRLIRKTEPYGQHEYGYDDVGNMTSKKDPKGNNLVYQYDALNRLEKITYPDATFVSYTYDANDNRIGMTDSLGASTYSYDDLNRMTSYTDPFGKTVGYGYDNNGNRTSMTYPDGKVVNYNYDKLNRLWTVTDWLGKVTTYSYDDTGNLFDILNPNNTKVVYSYDIAGRLAGLSNTKSDSTVISSYSYTLDAIGNHENVAQDEPLVPLIPGQNVAYTHDAENRMTDAGGVTNTFDANGNMTAKGSDTFAYDYNDRLVQSTVGGVVTQYRYDGFGNRLVKVDGGAATRYVQDINGSLSNVLAETDVAGTITAYYVYGHGLISQVMPDGTAYYYHYDSRGSTIALSDAGENITDAYAYDPFGKVVNRLGTTANPFRYVGRYGLQDEGNGLTYIRARYYVPEMGRFINKDPLTGKDGDNQSLNRYVYAVNSPVVLIDADGKAVILAVPILAAVGKFALEVAAVWAVNEVIVDPLIGKISGTSKAREIGDGPKDVIIATLTSGVMFIYPPLGIATGVGLNAIDHIFFRAERVGHTVTMDDLNKLEELSQTCGFIDKHGVIYSLCDTENNVPLIPEIDEAQLYESKPDQNKIEKR